MGVILTDAFSAKLHSNSALSANAVGLQPDNRKLLRKGRRFSISNSLIYVPSCLVIAVITATNPVSAQQQQTPEEKIEALEKKVDRLEKLLTKLLPEGSKLGVDQEAAQSADPSASIQTVETALSAAKNEPPKPKYTPKLAFEEGTSPSQNTETSNIYGETSCAMRVYESVSKIPENNAEARSYFASEEAIREAKFRPVSPDISYATRENPRRLVQCDFDQLIDKTKIDEIGRSGGRTTTRGSKGRYRAQVDRTNEALRTTGINSLIPGRPLQLGGFQPTLELGKSSTATLNLSVPIYGRTNSKNYLQKNWHRCQR